MPSPLQLGLSWLRAPANELAFLLRSTLRWRRGAPSLSNEDKRVGSPLVPWHERTTDQIGSLWRRTGGQASG